MSEAGAESLSLSRVEISPKILDCIQEDEDVIASDET